MENIEIWKSVVNYKGYFEISNLGNVRSLERIIFRSNGTTQRFKSKMLSVSISSNGYKSVTLCKNGISRMYNIHSLLMLSFFDENYIKNKKVVNHIDGNKLNNDFNNLEIVTSSDNNYHAIYNKLRDARKRKNTKLSYEQIKEIQDLFDSGNYGFLKDLSKKYNVSISYLSLIKHKKNGIIKKYIPTK
jgi:hypothetical protein